MLTEPLADGSRQDPLGRHVALCAGRNGRRRARQWLRPVDGPFGNFSDADAFKAAAFRAAVLGCEGKWAIHPSQIGLANEVMTPPKPM